METERLPPLPAEQEDMPARSSSERSHPGGFTLVEVLVAFVILALSLGGLLQVFGTGLRSSRVSESYGIASLLAQSRLATVGIVAPISVGETEGQFDDRFRWRVAVRPYEEDGLELGSPTLPPYEVIVTILWDERDEQRSVSLETLRLAPRR